MPNEGADSPFLRVVESLFNANWHQHYTEFLLSILFFTFGLSGCKTLTENPTHESPAELDTCARSMGFFYLIFSWYSFRVSACTGLFSPILTMFMVLYKKISLTDALLASTAQILGAIVSLAILWGGSPEAFWSHARFVRSYDFPSDEFIRSGLAEAVTTMILVLASLTLSLDRSRAKTFVPFGLGFLVYCIHMVIPRYSGGSANLPRMILAFAMSEDHLFYRIMVLVICIWLQLTGAMFADVVHTKSIISQDFSLENHRFFGADDLLGMIIRPQSATEEMVHIAQHFSIYPERRAADRVQDLGIFGMSLGADAQAPSPSPLLDFDSEERGVAPDMITGNDIFVPNSQNQDPAFLCVPIIQHK